MFSNDDLNCFSYSVSSLSKESAENLKYTNKLLLPSSVLYQINNLDNIEYPLFFKITNKNNDFGRVCSVHEFTSPPGVIHVPYYIMNELGIEEGSKIKLELVIPIKGSYIKLRPHSTDFINLQNPKAVLEKILSRDYSVITEGHTIALNYKELKRIFYIDIVETKPSNIIQIINTDVNVDFDKPLDYVEPIPQPKTIPKPVSKFNFNNYLNENENENEKNENEKFIPFSGKGYKLGNS